jgi:hypothetical protein
MVDKVAVEHVSPLALRLDPVSIITQTFIRQPADRWWGSLQVAAPHGHVLTLPRDSKIRVKDQRNWSEIEEGEIIIPRSRKVQTKLYVTHRGLRRSWRKRY